MTRGRGGVWGRAGDFSVILRHRVISGRSFYTKQTGNAIRGISRYYLGQRERIYWWTYREYMVNIPVYVILRPVGLFPLSYRKGQINIYYTTNIY